MRMNSVDATQLGITSRSKHEGNLSGMEKVEKFTRIIVSLIF